MFDYIEFLDIPAAIAFFIIALFFVLQIIGAILEFKGKTVPEIMRIKKYFDDKKEEREMLSKMPGTLNEMKEFLQDVKKHYNDDNIAKRNSWMSKVDNKLDNDQMRIDEINKKLDKHNEYILALIVENKRNIIIDFASRVANKDRYFTREQFNRVFKVYHEYEDIIKANNLANGEVNIAFRIITEAYEANMKNGTFVEDIRGYDV